MSNTPTTGQLRNVQKFPWQWAIIVLCAAVSAIFGLYVLSRDKGDESCQQRVANLQRIASKKDSIILDWQTKYINLSTELLYKNNIIDRQNEVIHNTDSLARKKLERPAKQIVKNHE